MSAVFIGRVGRPHGVDGELYVDRTALTAAELLAVGKVEWRSPRGERRPFKIAGARDTHDKLLVKFGGVFVREAAATLTNGELWAEADQLPDPGPGTAYTFQLVGLRVVDAAGNDLGVVREVMTTTAQPLYVIEHAGRERLVPGVPPFLKHVDIAAGVITLELPPGFEDLDS